MASRRLSSEIEGLKNRLSPVQQKSKIPVHRPTRLNNNSGKISSSKYEVNLKQNLLRNRVEKSQNKAPSRIPIVIGRTRSKDVGSKKIPSKNLIAATGKTPFGRDSGIVKVYIVIEAFGISFMRQTLTPFCTFLLVNLNILIQSLMICQLKNNCERESEDRAEKARGMGSRRAPPPILLAYFSELYDSG